MEVPMDIPFQHVKAFAFPTCDEQQLCKSSESVPTVTIKPRENKSAQGPLPVKRAPAQEAAGIWG